MDRPPLDRVTLDLRPLAPAERHRRIYEALDALAPGETLLVHNDHNPSPLRHELRATRPGELDWVDAATGPDTWTFSLTCRARVLDVRPALAAGREPFGTIMDAVAELDTGDHLVVVVPFEPTPLEGVLSAQGLAFEATPQDGGDWRVRFWTDGS